MLNNLTGTPQYLSWLARKLRPHIGDTVLEIGAGIGNLTGRLMARRLLYVAAEKDPLHLHALRNRFLRTPNVVVQRIDPEVPEDLADLENCFDTVLCLNVLEYLDDPRAVRRNRCARTLKPGGVLVVLVPQGPGAVRHARPRPGPQTPLSRRPDARAAARSRRASRWKTATVQQGRRAAVVGLQPDVRLAKHQQAGAQDLR